MCILLLTVSGRDDVELKDSKDAKEMLEKGLERYETSPHFIILYGVALRRKGQVEYVFPMFSLLVGC